MIETNIENTSHTSALVAQPLREVERDGVRYTILGTAHVSQASVDAVHAQIAAHTFDAVAIELCESRYQSMRDPDALAKLDLIRVIREGKTGLVAANLALAGYQRRLSEQLGVEPGAEMKAAWQLAEANNTPVWRIDRDVATTLKRTSAAVGFWDRMMLMSGVIASLIVDDEVDKEDIERLKEGDMLESTFGEFARKRESLYRALIAERDEFMAATLRSQADAANQSVKHVLVVIGAGHLAGLSQHLQADQEPPTQIQQRLTSLPPSKPWGTWITLVLTALVLGGFAYAFSKGVDIGGAVLLQWVLVTGSLGAVGCAVAGGHPLSILGAFVASPVTPLHPALASGTVSALIELWVRKPTVADFHLLRDDVGSVAGWWRNRVSRVLLNFFLTSMGTAIGVYVAGWQMIKALF
ncbi:MAG: TraB family protein [Alphaproteobacteria bacterium ADurb.BinA280]|nr:TraB/GumN family protein [Xanthomonadales bacterium]MCC6506947.1 TraB/GumN family protein [Aquimonas sp.]OPZ12583.1 MAG: TraB family protein [Alphaproteobacteria bacterium ADurb.BinA280]